MDELIAGDLPRGHQAEVTLEIPLLGGDDALVALRADIGLADSVFFLRNKGESALAAGMSGPEASAAGS